MKHIGDRERKGAGTTRTSQTQEYMPVEQRAATVADAELFIRDSGESEVSGNHLRISELPQGRDRRGGDYFCGSGQLFGGPGLWRRPELARQCVRGGVVLAREVGNVEPPVEAGLSPRNLPSNREQRVLTLQVERVL